MSSLYRHVNELDAVDCNAWDWSKEQGQNPGTPNSGSEDDFGEIYENSDSDKLSSDQVCQFSVL